jgi:hypothetical protein
MEKCKMRQNRLLIGLPIASGGFEILAGASLHYLILIIQILPFFNFQVIFPYEKNVIAMVVMGVEIEKPGAHFGDSHAGYHTNFAVSQSMLGRTMREIMEW